jgi:hypothetical protein
VRAVHLHEESEVGATGLGVGWDGGEAMTDGIERGGYVDCLTMEDVVGFDIGLVEEDEEEAGVSVVTKSYFGRFTSDSTALTLNFTIARISSRSNKRRAEKTKYN